MTPVLRVQNLQVSYFSNTVVTNVSFSVPDGSIVGMIGPNGAGKSTLLKAIVGLIPKDKGDVSVQGRTLKQARRDIAYVPQRRDMDWDFPVNVLDTVLMGTYPRLGLVRRPRKAEHDWALSCLEAVEMAHLHKRQIGELSGGQQARVFMARALAQRPNLLLLDEPFAGVDMHSEQLIMQNLRQLRQQGRSIIIVHHDLSKVRDYFDTVLIMNNHLVAYGPTDQCFNKTNVEKAYAAQLAFAHDLGMGA